MELILLIGTILAFWYVVTLHDKAGKYDAVKPQIDTLERDRAEIHRQVEILQHEKNALAEMQREAEAEREQKIKADRAAIETLYKQKAMGFPWLAQAYADYFALEDMKVQDHLKHKTRPAHQAAEAVKAASARRREAEFKYRVARYKTEYYESLFPWLKDLIAETEEEDLLIETYLDSSAADGEDHAAKFLTPEEYAKLPTAKKYQLALERYVARKKTKWEIGRDYERYVGYLWEQEGYTVSYHGAIEGLEDMGRDLIARKGKSIEVIQCKYWSQYKQIHEKHIFQLFGTTLEYWLGIKSKDAKDIGEFVAELEGEAISAVLVTSTLLSDRARDVAAALGVKILEELTLDEYPRIKCNVSSKEKEKIYHLPFDQQYDRIIIEPGKGEKYVSTVAEAEQAGFRRAFRWRG